MSYCSRCGSLPGDGSVSVIVARCPACRAEVHEPPVQGRFRCRRCNHDFEDYEDWVRRCRVAAYAAHPPKSEGLHALPPATRPPHLTAIGASLLGVAPVYGALGVLLSDGPLAGASCAAAAIQAAAGVAVVSGWRKADRLVRLASGLSVLLPPLLLTAGYFIALFAFFSRPAVTRYFGIKPEPAPQGTRLNLIAWLIVVSVAVLSVFLWAVPSVMETAMRWKEPALTPLMEAATVGAAFLRANAWWVVPGVVAALVVLNLWGTINRVGFVTVAVLSLCALVLPAIPTTADAFRYELAARSADEFAAERSVSRLLWGLREPDPKMRVAAARGVEAVGREAAPAVPVLTKLLEDEDRRVRFRAAVALARIDPEAESAVPVLLDARFSEDDLVAKSLGYLGLNARLAVPHLLKDLARSDAPAHALGEIGPAAIPGLTEALADPDPAVRRRAAHALGRIGPAARSAADALTGALKDRDPAARREALTALAEIQREKAIPQLLTMLREDPAAAPAAAAALCSLGQQEGLAAHAGGGNAFNALRRPAVWDHLRKTLLAQNVVEGTGREILQKLADIAVMRLEVAGDPLGKDPLAPFMRFHCGARRKSLLDVLTSVGVEFILESDRIRVLPAPQAAAFWDAWRANARGKRN